MLCLKHFLPCEPRKKNSYIPVYLFFSKDPYFIVYWFTKNHPHNWVGLVIPEYNPKQPCRCFFIAQIPILKLRHHGFDSQVVRAGKWVKPNSLDEGFLVPKSLRSDPGLWNHMINIEGTWFKKRRDTIVSTYVELNTIYIYNILVFWPKYQKYFPEMFGKICSFRAAQVRSEVSI